MFKTKAKPAPAKKTRRARGTGSIIRDKRRGGFVWKIPVGRYPDRDGKPGATKYTEVRGETQAECVEKGKLVKPPDPAAVTVREWAERWRVGLTVRPSTREGYGRQLDLRILPDLGHLRLAELTVSQVKAELPGWRDAAGTATANRTLAVGATMLAAAVLDGLRQSNPFADCPRLEHEAKPIDPFTPAELKAIIAARDRYKAGRLIAFLAGTGARVGEAAALDVADYDPATGAVRITKTWSRQHGTRPPKSRHGRRTIAVPPPVRAACAEAIGARTSGPLFAGRLGARYCEPQVFVALGRLLAAIQIRKRNPHQLRHGVATALVSAGVPIGDVAAYLGHTATQIVRTYLHPTRSDVAGRLAELLA